MSDDEVKVFLPNGATTPAGAPDPLGAAPATGPAPPASVRVADVTAERDMDVEMPLPLHLLGPAGEVAVQLRTTLRRVAVGAGLARRADLVTAVRALHDVPGLVTSPAGGTFVVGGDAWLGLAAIGAPPVGETAPIDWMLAAVASWLNRSLRPIDVATAVGRIDGAWCPGFSDVSAQGRKLVGLGFRVTREWVVVRGVMAVGAMSDADLAVLRAVHRLIDVDVRREACTSLEELTGGRRWTVPEAIELLRRSAASP